MFEFLISKLKTIKLFKKLIITFLIFKSQEVSKNVNSTVSVSVNKCIYLKERKKCIVKVHKNNFVITEAAKKFYLENKI